MPIPRAAYPQTDGRRRSCAVRRNRSRCLASDRSQKEGLRQEVRAGETEPPRFRSSAGTVIGDGRQFAIKGLQFGVREDCRRRHQVACGGSGKRFRLCRFRGNGRQGRHFHGEAFDPVAQCGAGLGEDCSLLQSEPAGPGRTRRQEDNPSVAHVREPGLASGRGGQEAAQSLIQRIQRTRAFRECVEGDALRGRPWTWRVGMERIAPWRHEALNRCCPR